MELKSNKYYGFIILLSSIIFYNEGGELIYVLLNVSMLEKHVFVIEINVIAIMCLYIRDGVGYKKLDGDDLSR